MPTRRGDGISEKSARIEGGRAGAPHRSPTSDVACKHDCEQANETLHQSSKYRHLANETLHHLILTNLIQR